MTMTPLEETLQELFEIILRIKEAQAASPTKEGDGFDKGAFFDAIRPLFKRLTSSQVSGTEIKLDLMREAAWPLSHAAYLLATNYHETQFKMQPVKEGLTVSDAYREKHFRYYPWYGRGDVQLTWEDNYKRADRELGLGGRLAKNPDVALEPDVSARVIVTGMNEGWFSKDKNEVPYDLPRMLPSDVATRAQFKQARRIINLMDKADLIAGYAVQFQDALRKAGW